MNGISSKITASAAAGALAGIITWALTLFGIVLPPEIAVEASVLIAFLAGYLVPETRVTGATFPDNTPTIK